MKRVIFSADAAGALRELDAMACGSEASGALPPAGSPASRAARHDQLDLRVVVARDAACELLASDRVPAQQLVAYSARSWPLLWLRLLWFLGLSRAAIICTASPHARGMKMLALALRGGMTLVEPDGERREVSLRRFVWLVWLTSRRSQGDVCLVGTTSAERLCLVVEDLRKRYPSSRIHALLPGSYRAAIPQSGTRRADDGYPSSVCGVRDGAVPGSTGEGADADEAAPCGTSSQALRRDRQDGGATWGQPAACTPAAGTLAALGVDSSARLSARNLLAACFRKPRFATVILPCAGDGPNRLKTLALLLPLGYIEIYNENNDSYAARDLPVVLRHFWWRLRQRPCRVVVVGAAKPEHIQAMVADVRRRHPAMACDGILPAGLASLAPLFDSAIVLSPFSARLWREMPSRLFGTRRSGYVVLPWTGNGYRLLKLIFWFLPMGRHEVYNENLDCYSGRDFGMLLRHVLWRLRVAARRAAYGAWNGAVRAHIGLIRIPNRVNVLAVASPTRLEAIVADVRRRHPGAICHGFLAAGARCEVLGEGSRCEVRGAREEGASCASEPAAPSNLAPRTSHLSAPSNLEPRTSNLFDSVNIVRPFSPLFWLTVLSRAFGPRRAGYFVLPWTREGYGLLKFVFFLLPLGRRELYNEHYHLCSARDLRVIPRHLWWRLRNPLRPARVTVAGSASGLFLKKIVADLRRRHPGAPIHALLPARLVRPAAALFDSHTTARLSSFVFWRDMARLAVGPRRSGHLIIPCTNEGFTALKALAFLMPFGLREIYNENADSYPARDLRMLVHHAYWRLWYRIFYQALTIRGNRSWPVQILQLAAYPLRLIPGAALLIFARLRALLNHVRRRPAPSYPSAPEPFTVPSKPQFDSHHSAAVTTDHSGD